MSYDGTQYDYTVCSTVKCNHDRDDHAASIFSAKDPGHCTKRGCTCGKFRPTPIRRTPPNPSNDSPATRQPSTGRRTKPEHDQPKHRDRGLAYSRH